MAVAVVDLAPVGVGEDLVGVGGLLEPFLGIGGVAVDVGVQLAREPAEGALDLALVGVARDPEDLVGVALDRHAALHIDPTTRDSSAAASRTVAIAVA